ncbi:probable tRNA (uracil-O(2)-)-methyltransferase [Bacillus rossius redtenbacheri]|uniref:probable tRNA (uracil-O(2)-)-methyltransferase n=1 Tax=Bacillus rossius redtenbacheri TaxID=93214 RepID=UPI002FDE9718
MTSKAICGMAPLASLPVEASRKQLWVALRLWYTRPHVVNRKLFMAKELFCGRVRSRPDVASLAARSGPADFVHRTGREVRDHLEHLGAEMQDVCELDLDADSGGMYVTARLLLPRKSDTSTPVVELSFINPGGGEMVFAVVPGDAQGQRFYVSCPYRVRAGGGVLEVAAGTEHHACPSADWLAAQLVPRLVKWAETAPEEGRSGLAAGSLLLVSEQRYHEVYRHLKETYGKELVQNWKEVTDPRRYVYEDIAIAAYLLVMWEQERQAKGAPAPRQSFVDLGCGNGLLVFLLSSEGHPGVGVDVRKRRIWDTYPPGTRLEVRAITPSKNCTFPQTDWIIGNHSDELTPWVPVIAARSSPHCCFFLLPCCLFDFDGSRYRRECSSSSRYGEYLEYVSRIALVCGYAPQSDRLRISSTKRKCIVGFDRKCSSSTVKEIDLAIQELIDERCGKVCDSSDGASGASGVWAEFTPRAAKEAVRNCTQIDKGIVQEILSLICNVLLGMHNSVVIRNDGEERLWNAGGCLPLKDLASLLSSEKLGALKKECGGLQTLLKNHRFLFVVEKGTVKLRIPLPKRELKNINWATWKIKPCWFHHNHPDGCPLSTTDCPSQH